jgi:hypothetical protein
LVLLQLSEEKIKRKKEEVKKAQQEKNAEIL